MKKQPLTDAQLHVLRFIKKFIKKKCYPPTCTEIAEGCGFKSPNAANEQVLRLAAKKWIVHIPRISRGIQLR